MIHLRHFKDGYPLCWPMDREGDFEGSFNEVDVDCRDCLGHMSGWDPPVDLAAVKRRRAAQDDGRCGECGGFRAVCSPMGRPCCYQD